MFIMLVIIVNQGDPVQRKKARSNVRGESVGGVRTGSGPFSPDSLGSPGALFRSPYGLKVQMARWFWSPLRAMEIKPRVNVLVNPGNGRQ